MSYYFNLEELRQEMSDARLFSRRFETMLTFKLNSLKELCGRLPRENEAFFIETKKSFTAFTFIVYLIKNAGQVRHLYIATYSTNERIINALLRWREKGLIGSIHLHISETIKFRMPKIYERLIAPSGWRDRAFIRMEPQKDYLPGHIGRFLCGRRLRQLW